MKVLVVAYYFPPVGGGGVNRTLKVVRGLVDAGAQPRVLTVDDAAWARDPGLLEEVPRGARVTRLLNPDWGRVARRARRRAPDASPGRTGGGRLQRLLIPDLCVGWSAIAAPFAARLAATGAIDVVYTTAPPYSANAVGLAARAAGVPWVADFRDAWTDCPTRAGLPRWRQRVERRLENWTLRRADRVLFASDGARARAVARIPDLATRSETVLTGFDPRDFCEASAVTPPRGRLELVHAGSVLVMNRLPTLLSLLGALQLWSGRDERVATTVRVRFVGAEPEVATNIERAGLQDWVSVEPAVPRASLGRLLRGAHACLVLASATETGGDPIPGKLFDALGAGRPLLALAPEGALARVVRGHALGPVVDPHDGRAIVRELVSLHARALRGEAIEGPPEESRRILDSDRSVARIVAALARPRARLGTLEDPRSCVSPSAS